MLAKLAKHAVRKTAAALGYEIRKIAPPAPVEVYTPEEPAPFASPPPDPTVHGLDSMEGCLRFLRERGVVPRCVLDVGANETRWARLAARVFPESRFVLIEPQEEMVPALAAFCGAHPSARFVRAGAAAQPGEAVQTIWDDLQGSTFVVPAADQMLRAGRQRVTPMVTIDEVFAGEPHLPELVKLDIQGYELEALKGAGRLFGRTEVFILEVQLIRSDLVPDLHAVVDFMHRRNYQVYDICGYLRRPVDDALGQVDLVFARSDGPLCRDHRWSASDGPPPPEATGARAA
ncbi:MAG: FkbM family methyltransferase [Planctomycetes bacterium]|nr:FkbM family methyltransferase [Planctomycetota bacterium]